MPRWSKIGFGVLALLVVAAGVTVAVAWAKLPQIVAGRASAAIGRTVQIGAVTVSPGWWISVALHDVSVANLPGGTRPDMATLRSVTGELELWPLFHRTLVARSVHVQEADILLERVGEQPNWRNGPKQPETPGGGRAGFPTILGAVLEGVLTFRTFEGHVLVTRLDGVKLEASAADQPVRITGPGSYRDVPLVFDMTLGSYDQLHDVATPFPTDITLTSGDTTLHFIGTMTKPLKVEGAVGHLNLVAPTLGALEKVVGMDPAPAPSLHLEGALQHDDHLWKLEHATGALGTAPLEDGTLQLEEGSKSVAPKIPDKVDLVLRFAEVDADRLAAAFKGGGGGSRAFVPFADPNPQITASLQASALTYEKTRVTNPKLSLAVEPGIVTLDAASFGWLGGTIRLDGQDKAEADGKAGAARVTLSGTGLDVAALRQVFGAGRLPLAGRVDIHAVAEGVGPTAAAALKAARASIVATMQGGSVSMRLIELASTDVSGLLRSSQTMVPLNCLLMMAEVRGGVATVGPVRLRSAGGTIVARGQVDLLRETLDVVVASEPKTTGALALDVPVRVSGKFDDPSIEPAAAAAGRAALTAGPIAGPLRAYAQRGGCAR